MVYHEEMKEDTDTEIVKEDIPIAPIVGKKCFRSFTFHTRVEGMTH